MSNLLSTELNSNKINQLVEQLTNEVLEVSSKINQVKPAQEQSKKANTLLVQKLGDNRGRPLFFPYIGSGLGKGCYVEIEDGSIKLDLINGIGINIFGHSSKEMIKASIKGALQDVVMQGNLQPGKEMLALATKLVELSTKQSRMKHCWLTTSGSMSNENALKMCRQKTNGAKKIIAMQAAFAGRTTMMAEVTDNPTMRVGLPGYDEVLRIPFFDGKNPNSTNESLEILKEHIKNNKDDICAFMFEPMQGEGGYVAAPREFFIPLFEEVKKAGIPIWADEIQTFCRTGEFFAFETLNIGEYIDICTVAKTLQGAATLYTEGLNPKPGLIAGTFAGSTVAMTAGLEVLNVLDTQNFMGPSGKISKIHKEFVGMLNDLNSTTCKGLLKEAGGLGLMVGVTPLDGSREKMIQLVKSLYDNGLMCFGCGRGPFRVRFLIPAVMTSKDIQVAKELIEKSIKELA